MTDRKISISDSLKRIYDFTISEGKLLSETSTIETCEEVEAIYLLSTCLCGAIIMSIKEDSLLKTWNALLETGRKKIEEHLKNVNSQ